jgi:tryptophan-rich sensory protein
MTSPTGRRPRNFFFVVAVLNFLGILFFLYHGSLGLAVVSGLIAVACVYIAARPRGGT